MNIVGEKMPRLVADLHARVSSPDSVIRSFRTTADTGRPSETDYVLANSPFNDSDWFRKDDDVRWQFGGTKSNTRSSWR